MQFLVNLLVGVSSGTVASSATLVASSVVTDGLDPTTGWAGGIVVSGVAIILGVWRYLIKPRLDTYEVERRAHDAELRGRLAESEDRVRELEAENREYAIRLARLERDDG